MFKIRSSTEYESKGIKIQFSPFAGLLDNFSFCSRAVGDFIHGLLAKGGKGEGVKDLCMMDMMVYLC